jgi:tRNA threonylcarbamoyladenosine biosynthesis protein TsaE
MIFSPGTLLEIMDILSTSVEETRKAGALLTQSAKAGDIYALIGELGTGKTEFVRGFVASLCAGCAVRSPTFTLVNIYDTPAFQVYHFDFYRLKKADELIEIGFHEYVQGDGVCFIEWADMFLEAIPSAVRQIKFIDQGNGQRLIVFDKNKACGT